MMKINIRDLKGKKQERLLKISNREIDIDARTVPIVFSTESPVERWWGIEILDHSPGSVRLDRAADGGAVLFNHDRDAHLGVIETISVDADRKGRAVIRFSKSALGEEKFNDVRDNILTSISVGYMIHDVVLEESKEGVDTYRVNDWEPVEVSMVTVPADNDAKVGRTFNDERGNSMKIQKRNEDGSLMVDPDGNAVYEEIRDVSDPPAAPAAPAAPVAPVAPAAPVARTDDAQMIAIGERFSLESLARDHIALGTPLAEFQGIVRTHMGDRLKVVPSVPSEERIQIPRYAGKLRAFNPDMYDGSRSQACEAAHRTGMWIKATLFGDVDAERWCTDAGVRVMTGTGGGNAIVPDEMLLPMISLREAYGIARRVCYIHNMTSNTASVPRDAADSEAYFTPPTVANTASDPDFDDVNLVARELTAETRIDNAYAADSAINLAEHVTDKQARSFAVKEDNCLFNGDGTSTYGGIVGIRTLLLTGAGAIDAASGNDTFAEITSTDLRGAMGAIQDVPGLMPSWYASRPAIATTFGRLKDAAGGNTKNNLSEGEPDAWAGYDIERTPAMPKSLGDLSNVVMLVFGDLRLGVTLGNREGVEIMVDPYSLSSYRQTKVLSTERFDIVAHGVGDASNTGPVVALLGE